MAKAIDVIDPFESGKSCVIRGWKVVDSKGCNFKGETLNIGQTYTHSTGSDVQVGSSGLHYATSPLALMNPLFRNHFLPHCFQDTMSSSELRYLEISDIGTERSQTKVRWIPPNANDAKSNIEVISHVYETYQKQCCPAIEFYKMATNCMQIVRELSHSDMLALCTGYVDITDLGRVWFSNALFGYPSTKSTLTALPTTATTSEGKEEKEKKSDNLPNGLSLSVSTTTAVTRPTIEYNTGYGCAWLHEDSGFLHRDEASGPAYFLDQVSKPAVCIRSGASCNSVVLYMKRGVLFRSALDPLTKKLLPAATSCGRQNLTVFTVTDGAVASDVVPSHTPEMGIRLVCTNGSFGSATVPAVIYENGDTECWCSGTPISIGGGADKPTHTFVDRQEWRTWCSSFSSTDALQWRLGSLDGIVMNLAVPSRVSSYYSRVSRDSTLGPAVVYNPQYRVAYVDHCGSRKFEQSMQLVSAHPTENVSVIPLAKAVLRATTTTTKPFPAIIPTKTKAIVITAALLTVGGVVAYFACSRKRTPTTLKLNRRN